VLYINGPTGLGKTQWARSLLPEATVISHRDQLRDCDFSKGIIFDDFDVSHWPPTAVIHLLDWDEPRGLDVKHGHVVIPPHTRKIFTHNREFERWLSDDATAEQWRLADAVYMLSIYMYLSTENGRRPSLPRPPKPISNRSLRKEGPVVFGDGGQAEIGPHWANNATGEPHKRGFDSDP